MSSDFISAGRISRGVAGKSFSAVEITESHISKIKANDEKIGAFLTLCEEDALAQARAIDKNQRRPACWKAGRCAGRHQGQYMHRWHQNDLCVKNA